QTAAARPERREIGCAQLDRLDWLLKFFLVKSFPQEDGQTRGIPGYGSEPDVEFLGRGIEMDQAQREGADALMSRSEQAFELGEQPPRGKEQRFGMRRFARQLEPRRKARRRREESISLRQPAAGAIQSVDGRAAAALRETVARQGECFTDGGDTDAAEEIEVEAGRFQRQRRERTAAATRPPQRRQAGGRHGQPGGQAERIEPGAQRLEKGVLAAEIAQARRDFDEQRIRRRLRDPRRELAGPAGERRERFVPKAWKVQRDPKHGKVFSPAGAAAPRTGRRDA